MPYIQQEVHMSLQYTYWKDADYFIGYLNEFPDYETEGKTLEELQQNLRDIYNDIQTNEIPFIRRTAELVLA
jgi:hypothetical protein